jgi:hypothetical protein
MAKSKRSWRRIKSKSAEELWDWILGWVVVFFLLGLLAYCAITAKPVYAMGAPLVALGGWVRGRGGSDP